jgi:hypothetical protein
MKKLILALIILAFLVLPVFDFAQAYTLLEPLPGLKATDQTKGVTLSDYLGWLFPFVISAAAILAVLMIVIGGIELMAGGNEKLRTDAKDRIWSAIWGLLLALSAWLILSIINPNLVNMELGIDPVTVKVQQQQTGAAIGRPARSETQTCQNAGREHQDAAAAQSVCQSNGYIWYNQPCATVATTEGAQNYCGSIGKTLFGGSFIEGWGLCCM